MELCYYVLFLKLREGMKRSFGLFNLVMYSMEHSYLFLDQ